MCNPRVYVGTYAKYNSGSIAGGWISLAECENYGQFLSKCKELHKDEREPEYMIQDNENFPDGLDCMEWLSKEEFEDVRKAMTEDDDKPNVSIVDYSEKSFVVTGDTYPIRKELKQLGGSWFRKANGWIFPNKSREAVEKFIDGGEVKTTTEKTNKFVEWLQEFVDTQCTTESDKKYYGKNNVGAIKIDGHYYLIGKPSIENKFCFHDEGADYEFYKTLCANECKMRKYFIDENESHFTNKIESIVKGEDVRIKAGDYKNMICLYIGNSFYWYEKEGREATAEERKLIIEGLKFGLEKFHTRLNAYLKRYGISKLHTWTYWADA